MPACGALKDFQIAALPLQQSLGRPGEVPGTVRTAVRNKAGGAYLGNSAAGLARTAWGRLPPRGRGRNVYAGITVKF